MEFYCPKCGYANSNRDAVSCAMCGYVWDERAYESLRKAYFYCPKCGYAHSNRSDMVCCMCGYVWDKRGYESHKKAYNIVDETKAKKEKVEKNAKKRRRR